MSFIASSTPYLSAFPVELFFIGGLWLVAAAFAFKSGVSRISMLAVALSLAGLLFPRLPAAWPFASAGAESASGWATSILTLALLAGAFIFIMHRIGIDTSTDSGRAGASIVGAAALVAIMLCLWANIPALGSLYLFPQILAPYFSVQYFFWWLLVPLAALALLTERRMW